jgi:hypothetical protein
MIPTVSLLVDIAFRVNAALASPAYDTLKIEHVYAVAQREHLFDSLRGWLGTAAEPWSALRPEDRAAVNEMFARLATAVTPEDFGIDPASPRAALALVMAMLLEGIKEAGLEPRTTDQTP